MIYPVITASVKVSVNTGKVAAAMTRKTARVLTATASYARQVLQAGISAASRAAGAVQRANRAAYRSLGFSRFTRSGYRRIAPTRFFGAISDVRRVSRRASLSTSALRFVVTPVVIAYKTLRILIVISPIDDVALAFLALVFGEKRARDVQKDAGVVRRRRFAAPGNTPFNIRGEVEGLLQRGRISAADDALRKVGLQLMRNMETVPLT